MKDPVFIPDYLHSALGTNEVETIANDFFIADFKPSPDNFHPRPHRTSFLIIIVCLEGNCRFSVNLYNYELRKHDLISLLPYSLVEPSDYSPDCRVRVIGFNPAFLSTTLTRNVPFYLSMQDRPQTRLTENETELFDRYYEFIRDRLLRNDSRYRTEVVQNLLHALLVELADIYRKEPMPELPVSSLQENDLLRKFMELVVEHYLKQRNVGFYADRLCLTPKYLSKVIKRLSGHTVPVWISRILVLHAQVLLKSSKQTVQQIALELNFPNASFFGRFFKKHTGMTPGQYRLKS